MFLETLKTPLGPGADVAVGEAALYLPVVPVATAPRGLLSRRVQTKAFHLFLDSKTFAQLL